MLPGDPLVTAFAVALDAVIVLAALIAGLLLRFDGDIPRASLEFTLWAFPLIAAGYIGANLYFGVYRTVWTYASIADALNVLRSVLIVTAIIFVASLLLEERKLPLAVVLIAGILIFPAMVTVRMRTRIIAGLPWSGSKSRRLLVVGAGRTGQLLVRTLREDPMIEYQPVGFLDDDPALQDSRIQGLRVLGTVDDLEEIIDRYSADLVAVALPRVHGDRIREVLAICQQRLVPIRMVPPVGDWADGHDTDVLRSVTLDDLLGREPVQIDYDACAASVAGKVVIVTGAAGSIGSELCRQILQFHPLELHMLDNNETGLFDLGLELGRDTGDTVLRQWVVNIADEPRIEAIFSAVRPAIVYHAAALKHVPLMEEHPGEAFRVNVLGTRNVALAARTYQAETFILISTDKAVRPSSVMGATQRIAELIVLGLGANSEYTTFAAVRFGNVIGSRGSVVPIFMRQIEQGGPVTVMHRDMMRYFISIPEAVSLVIEAGSFADTGEIFMLDMGEEINILELAERIIRLRGYRPNRDIDVVFTGPRPGEKLREDLVSDTERMEPTEHPRVRRLSATVDVDETEIIRLVDSLAGIMWSDPDEVRRRVHLVARHYGAVDEADRPSESSRRPAS
jgi:FlaA1/EpsC-like NDP-sugar epimerase